MSETTVTDVAIGGRSGIGAAPLTVSVPNFDPSLGCDVFFVLDESSVVIRQHSNRALSARFRA
jgi:hypothetical protein